MTDLTCKSNHLIVKKLIGELFAQNISEIATTSSEHQDRTRNSKVIYTAIFGDYDTLNEPICTDNSTDLICFTDNKKLVSKKWKLIFIETLTKSDKNTLAKAIKVLPHIFLASYKCSIWIDGSILIKESPWHIIKNLNENAHFIFTRHPDRNCIYEEIDECRLMRKESESKLSSLLSELTSVEYPRQNGLISGGFIFRINNPQVAQIFESWMFDILKYSKRDQLTFNYVCWKHRVDISYSEENVFNNRYFVTMPHTTNSFNRIKRSIKHWLVVKGIYI